MPQTSGLHPRGTEVMFRHFYCSSIRPKPPARHLEVRPTIVSAIGVCQGPLRHRPRRALGITLVSAHCFHING